MPTRPTRKQFQKRHLVLTFGVCCGVGDLLKRVQKGPQDGDGCPAQRRRVVHGRFTYLMGDIQQSSHIKVTDENSLECAVKFARLGNELVKVRNADLESKEEG